jgi:hypothetical protein
MCDVNHVRCRTCRFSNAVATTFALSIDDFGRVRTGDLATKTLFRVFHDIGHQLISPRHARSCCAVARAGVAAECEK